MTEAFGDACVSDAAGIARSDVVVKISEEGRGVGIVVWWRIEH